VLETARGGKISSRLLSSLTHELLLLEGRLLSKILDSEDFTLVGSVETGITESQNSRGWKGPLWVI